MTPQDWESPAMFAAPITSQERERPELAAAYAMRPLSTGEILDRTFSIYRSRFWLFAGISSVSGAVQLVANAVNLTGQHFVRTRYGFSMASVESGIGSAIGGLIFLLAVAVTQAATVYALSEVYLGREATIGSSLRSMGRLWYRYAGIALWQAWSAVWVILLLILPTMLFFVPRFRVASSALLGGVYLFLAVIGGSVYGVIAYIRNSLAVPAAVVEQSKVRPSMRRSKTLTSGTKGRIFVVLLVAVALGFVGGAIQMPMAFLILRSPLQPHVMAQAMILAISFLTHTLVAPVAMIGLSLVYFDQRVRKEAFDLVMLMGAETPVDAAGFAAPHSVPFAAPVATRVAVSPSASGELSGGMTDDPADRNGDGDRL